MFFGKDDDIFSLVPDFDGDGDHDLIDFLIMDEILREDEAGLGIGLEQHLPAGAGMDKAQPEGVQQLAALHRVWGFL
ncbi:MAG: hypothetical protein IJV00_01390, partial [Clostridia bacterium]|nr:hypothetical protein [Clostridia bacterium]